MTSPQDRLVPEHELQEAIETVFGLMAMWAEQGKSPTALTLAMMRITDEVMAKMGETETATCASHR